MYNSLGRRWVASNFSSLRNLVPRDTKRSDRELYIREKRVRGLKRYTRRLRSVRRNGRGLSSGWYVWPGDVKMTCDEIASKRKDCVMGMGREVKLEATSSAG